jgi:dTDP-glucose 4,6-dehydratase
MMNPLAQDLDRVLANTRELWEELRGARVFITGGTGFFGCWLLESLLWANDQLKLGVSVVALTRNASAFERKAPHLARHPAVSLHEGDARTFTLIDKRYSHVIHAATDSSTTLAYDDRLRVFDTIVEGTRRTLELARRSGAKRFLLTSSGAVYGRQPSELMHLPEEYIGAPDVSDWRQVYAEGKRAAEMLCALYADAKLQPTIARCFAFVGPYLPLDVHFAVGNFIRDAMHEGPIRISGDGTPYRSYLYAADLATWLWTILLRGQPLRPYNVGSEAAISIADLAHTVARTLRPSAAVDVSGTPTPGRPAERYVPSTARIRQELGVGMTVNLEEAITRTAQWHTRISASAVGTRL